MFTILFWNIKGKSPRSGIVELLRQLDVDHSPDLVALAECEPTTAVALVRRVNRDRGRAPIAEVIGTKRVRLFWRGSSSQFTEQPEFLYPHERFQLWVLDRGPRLGAVLLAPVHMISLLEKTTTDINQQLRQLTTEVRQAARVIKQVVVFGDLNAHPFSEGVCQAGGLHGVMTPQLARGEHRPVVFQQSPMLFNPMWRFYGNQSPDPPGTYFRLGNGDELVYFWNLFDQFLISPALLPYYRPDSVRILTGCTGTSFLKNGRPDADAASDHLPILMTLDC